MESNKNRTKSTEAVGSSDYKGYNSIKVGRYDDMSDEIEQTASEMGGVFDNDAKTYGGQRYKFRTKEARDRFNRAIEKKAKDDKDKQKNKKQIAEAIIRDIVLEGVKKTLMPLLNEK